MTININKLVVKFSIPVHENASSDHCFNQMCLHKNSTFFIFLNVNFKNFKEKTKLAHTYNDYQNNLNKARI